MKEAWKYYSVIPLILWGYSVMGKPKGNTLGYMWIVYIIVGAILGNNLI